MWPQILVRHFSPPGVFLSWLSSLGSSHASVANMFPGLTEERDDSVIES